MGEYHSEISRRWCVRHRAGWNEPEENLGPLLFRLFLFFIACALVLLALRSDVSDPGGAILLPVRGVSPDELTDSFSDRRDFFRRHGAIDIHAPWGTPVVASEDGVIHRLLESDRGGLGIYQMDGRSRRCYYYAHLARYAFGLEEGAPVTRGDVLGFVGATGNASADAPHLHFAAYDVQGDGSCFSGIPVNPLSLLAAD
jgi:murein DD-endopeptidase MepM/ murein hydrolase activator NlpD